MLLQSFQTKKLNRLHTSIRIHFSGCLFRVFFFSDCRTFFPGTRGKRHELESQNSRQLLSHQCHEWMAKSASENIRIRKREGLVNGKKKEDKIRGKRCSISRVGAGIPLLMHVEPGSRWSKSISQREMMSVFRTRREAARSLRRQTKWADHTIHSRCCFCCCCTEGHESSDPLRYTHIHTQRCVRPEASEPEIHTADPSPRLRNGQQGVINATRRRDSGDSRRNGM